MGVHALEDARSESGVVFDEIDGIGVDMSATDNSPPTKQHDQILSGLRRADSAEEKKVWVQRAKAIGIDLHGEDDGKGGGNGKQQWGYDPSGPEDYDEGGDSKGQRWRRARDKRRSDSDNFAQNGGKGSSTVK